MLTNQKIEEVKRVYQHIGEASQKADLDSFLSYYDDSPTFVSITSEGKMTTFNEFKAACSEYYKAITHQDISTIEEKFNVVDENLVILSWTGDITAHLKSGNTIKMKSYSITSVFRKIEGKWKVIHDHESALPPEIIGKN